MAIPGLQRTGVPCAAASVSDLFRRAAHIQSAGSDAPGDSCSVSSISHHIVLLNVYVTHRQSFMHVVDLHIEALDHGDHATVRAGEREARNFMLRLLSCRRVPRTAAASCQSLSSATYTATRQLISCSHMAGYIIRAWRYDACRITCNPCPHDSLYFRAKLPGFASRPIRLTSSERTAQHCQLRDAASCCSPMLASGVCDNKCQRWLLTFAGRGAGCDRAGTWPRRRHEPHIYA